MTETVNCLVDFWVSTQTVDECVRRMQSTSSPNGMSSSIGGCRQQWRSIQFAWSKTHDVSRIWISKTDSVEILLFLYLFFKLTQQNNVVYSYSNKGYKSISFEKLNHETTDSNSQVHSHHIYSAQLWNETLCRCLTTENL